jgi:hypothetical protein
MSQHHFFIEHEGQKTHVLMGWDRPLQGYFLVINKENDTDSPYWSNLDVAISHPNALNTFFDVLARLNITLPDEMSQAIEKDAEQNKGNRQVIHQITLNGYQCLEGIDPCKAPLAIAFSKYGLEKTK